MAPMLASLLWAEDRSAARINYNSSTDLDRPVCADRNSNRTCKDNTVTTLKGRILHLRQSDRLKNLDHGSLNGGKDAISGTPVKEEDWTFDATSNWSGYAWPKPAAVQTLNRPAATARPMSQFRGEDSWHGLGRLGAGSRWKHDRFPKPGNLAASLTAIYDAWNTWSSEDGANTVAKYKYDGSGRRIVRRHASVAYLIRTRQ